MPSIIIERQECKKEMWDALKRHIVRSRQKKKEELEEEEAEERQRKLREEQYQKERMTLEETRSQLRSLESHLAKCRDEKHELFLQLKKVLHESESRRAAKAELRTQLFPQQPNVQTHNIQAYAPPRQYIKAGYGGEMISSQEVTEDGRRGLNEHGGRAVLWNKSQYSTAAQRFYPTPHPSAIHSAHVISTVTHHVVPQAQAAAPPPTSVAAPPPSAITTTEREREREREQREQRERERDQRDQREREREREAPPASKPGPVHASFTPQPRPQTHTQYQDKFYSVRPATHVQPATHVPIHGGAIPIQQSPQNAKTGSITSGYPVRSPAPPTVSQHASPHASPQPPTRPTFQPAGPIINALPVVGVGPAGLTRQAVLTESASALSRSHDTSRPSPQAIFAPHRLIPITSASTSMGQLPSHPVPGGHGAAGHGPPHSSSHASHPSSHALSHPHHGTHPHPGSHSSSHTPAHVSHGTHPHSQPQPIPSLGHPSVLHTTHQQVLQVSVSQSHQGHQGPPGRFTMSSMPRES